MDGKKIAPEIRIIDCKKEIENPQIVFRAKEILPEVSSYDAIVFDMDGTLTLPGQIDFAKMREMTKIADPDIVGAIRSIESREERQRCMSIVEHLELEAFKDLQLMPGIEELHRLKKRGLKIALQTVNMRKCVDILIKRAGLAGVFDEIISRDCSMKSKPAPDALLALSAHWNIECGKMLIVGDLAIDCQCGRNAGSRTCLIGDLPDSEIHAADYVISDLRALQRIIQ